MAKATLTRECSHDKEVIFLSKHLSPRRSLVLLCTALLALSLTVPASALSWGRQDSASPSAEDFTKNGPLGSAISFSEDDFVLQDADHLTLSSITLVTLPSADVGTLFLGDQPLQAGSVIDRSALSGLRFQPIGDPADVTAAFTFTPTFSDGSTGPEATVTLFLLTQTNEPPVAENLTLNTYRDTPVTGYFSAMDPENGLLTFQLTDRPARGSVSFDEGESAFVYTPYEGKTGKDSFSYVAIDEVGNVSMPAKVSVKITKPSTKVTYSDLEGSAAAVSAIRLAEENIFVGECMGSKYFFRPDSPVSRSEFVAMAMAVAGVDPLSGISVTGFADDDAIPTWAKGYVSSALRSGLVQGMPGGDGRMVFSSDAAITRGEATVVLDRALSLSDVTTDVFYPDRDAAPAWAYQSAVNLETAGVLRTASDGSLSLSGTVSRGEAAEMLCAAMDVLDARRSSSLFG